MTDASHYPLMSPFTSHRDGEDRRGKRLGFGGDRFKSILYDSIVPREISGSGSLCGDPRVALMRAKYKEGLRTVLEQSAAPRSDNPMISERYKKYREAVRFNPSDCSAVSGSSAARGSGSSSTHLQVRTMDWSPEGTKLLFNLDDGSLKLYDVNGLSNGPIARWDEGKTEDSLHKVSSKFLAESCLIASISRTGKFQVLDARCAKQQHSVVLSNTKKEMRDFIGLKASKVMPEIALLTSNGQLFIVDRRMPHGFLHDANKVAGAGNGGKLRMHGNTIGDTSATSGSSANSSSTRRSNARNSSKSRNDESPRNDRTGSLNSSRSGNNSSSGNDNYSSSGSSIYEASGWNDVRISLIRQAHNRHYQQQVNGAHSLGVVPGNGMRPDGVSDERSDPRSRRYNNAYSKPNSYSRKPDGHPYGYHSSDLNNRTRGGSSRRKEVRHRCRFVDRSLWSDESDYEDELGIRDERARRERGDRRSSQNSSRGHGSQNNGDSKVENNNSKNAKDGDDKNHVEYPFNLEDHEGDENNVKNIREKINDVEYVGSQLFMACQGKKHAPDTLSVFRDANFSHRIDIPNAHSGGLITLCGHTGSAATGKCGAYNGGYGGDVGSFGGEEAFLGDEDDYFGGLHGNQNRNRLGSTDSTGDTKKDSAGSSSSATNVPATVDCSSNNADGTDFPFDPVTSADRIFFNRSCEIDSKSDLSYSGRTLAVNDALAGDGMNRGYPVNQHMGNCGGPRCSVSTNPHGLANGDNHGKDSKNSGSSTTSTAKKFASYYCPGGGGRVSMAASDLSNNGAVGGNSSGGGGSYFHGTGGLYCDPWCPYDDQNTFGQHGFGFCGGFGSFGGGSNNNAAGTNSGILVTTGMDHLIKVWNLRTFEQINSFCCSLEMITTMDLNHDCGLLAFGCGGSPGNLYKVPKSDKSGGSSRYSDDYVGSDESGSGDSKFNLTIVDPWTGEIMLQSQLDMERSPSIVKWHPWRNILCVTQETKISDTNTTNENLSRAPVQILKVPEY